MLKVYKKPCKNCLCSNNRIVSLDRMNEIIEDCKKEQTHFICHKASIKNEQILCHSFYKKYGHFSQLVQIAQRLNMVKFVEVPKGKKLPTHVEMTKGK